MIATIESANIERRQMVRGDREHRQRKAQEAVAAHLQKDAGKDDRARRRRLDMRIGQPGMHRPHRRLDRKRREERKPQPGLHAGREVRMLEDPAMSVVPVCR